MRTKSKISQSQKGTYCVILPRRGPCGSQIHRQKLRWWVPRAGEGDDREVVFNGDRLSVEMMRKFLWMDDGCTTT